MNIMERKQMDDRINAMLEDLTRGEKEMLSKGV
jgi:hypothetical protein